MKYVRALLDNSLDLAIAVARVLSVLLILAGVVASFGVVWAAGDVERWIGTMVLAYATGIAVGYLAFYTFGNEEWRRGKTDDRAAAVRHD